MREPCQHALFSDSRHCHLHGSANHWGERAKLLVGATLKNLLLPIRWLEGIWNQQRWRWLPSGLRFRVERMGRTVDCESQNWFLLLSIWIHGCRRIHRYWLRLWWGWFKQLPLPMFKELSFLPIRGLGRPRYRVWPNLAKFNWQPGELRNLYKWLY